jgi:hypothetical protein
VSTGLILCEEVYFAKLDKKGARDPAKKDRIEAKKREWIQVVRAWIDVTLEGLETAARTGSAGADLVQTGRLNDALAAMLGEDWDADEQLWTSVALGVVGRLFPSGPLTEDAREVLLAITEEFQALAHAFEGRHPR